MKKVFLMLASLALALSAWADNVVVTVDVAGKDAAEFRVEVSDGFAAADVTVKINGTECVFDGATGVMKSGTPDLAKGVKSVQVKYAGRTAFNLAHTGDDILVNGKVAQVVSADCDAVWVDCEVGLTVADLLKEYPENALVYDSESNCLDDDAVLKFGKEYTVVYESDGMIKKKIINY